MVSYNVTSLFSNIPLEETRNLTIDYLFEAKPDLKISRKDLQKLFQFATSQTNFLFNENIYEQIGRVAMSWPLAPILAHIFIGYREHEWIKNCNYEALLYLKGILMMHFQFMKLKIILFHLTVISMSNTVTKSSSWKLKKR